MNTGEYYNRTLNYKNWGYDNYYSLIDDGNYDDASYQLDRELILNEFFYEKMFKQEKPFMNYVITYTVHTPFKMTVTDAPTTCIGSKLSSQSATTAIAIESAIPGNNLTSFIILSL